MAVTTGKVLRYAALPGIIPRFQQLFRSGFFHTASLTALIFQSVRLLPAGHPYLNPANFGRFGIRHVIAEASRHLVFSTRNIDQIIVFFTILTGFVLLGLQFLLLILALLQQPALAFADLTDWLATPSANTPFGPEQDIAMILLDLVFGTQNIFNSCISNAGVVCVDNYNNPVGFDPGGAYPFPIHIALRQIFFFYSWGIFMVGVLLILYFVITIIGETIVSGTPFGQRYNHAWVPIRLIVFFALLAPLGGLNGGYNAAQIITFWTAKWGSNFATNAWGRFNDMLAVSYLGDINNLIALPNIPQVGPLVQFFHVAKMCQMAEMAIHGNDIQAYLVRENNSAIPGNPYADFMATGFGAAQAFTQNGTLYIRFGKLDPANSGNYKGGVNPLCGEVSMSIGDIYEPGSRAIMEAYYENLQDMWDNPNIVTTMECMLRRILPTQVDPVCNNWPGRPYAIAQTFFFNVMVALDIQNGIDAEIAALDALGNRNPWVLQKGWAGAAIWYNSIAKMNGAVTAAVFNVPKTKLYPFVMEKIVAQRKALSADVSGPWRFDPLLADNHLADLPRQGDQYIAAALYAAYTFWENDGYAAGTANADVGTGSLVLDAINIVFGTSGMFEMRRNTETHPLAQLSSIGRGLIEATIRNLLFAGAAQGLSKIFGGTLGEIAQAGSTFVVAVSRMLLVMGVILFYVLPFLPFIYFFFAVSSWVKSIFEAVVGMPLWALAHIRIDGEGLPGQGASNGYFLLLEVFLRPVLIVTGLIAAMSMFSATVFVLNNIFDLVVANMTGYDKTCELLGCGPTMVEFYRGPIDELFFTAVYVIIAYLLGNSSFKLIDEVPSHVMRWAGISIQTLQEGEGEAAAQFTGQIYKGTSTVVSQATGGRLAALLAK